VPERPFTDAEVDAAIDALSDPDRFKEAEGVLMRAAPQLQRILNQALAEGGWFEQTAESQLRQALATEDPQERAAKVATLLAEETRIGMMIGAAVGWALHEELTGKRSG
jgi:hypothetical protein